MIFPVDEGYYSGSTLGSLRLTWYSNIQPAKTVEIVNYMKNKADAGDQIFYRIYTDSEIAADPWKANTGLFFFKGKAQPEVTDSTLQDTVKTVPAVAVSTDTVSTDSIPRDTLNRVKGTEAADTVNRIKGAETKDTPGQQEVPTETIKPGDL
jgi:hypothetical protein